jgi:pyruvate dehydrogenase E2 component (dihydrolipoamide acetyltransferase)
MKKDVEAYLAAPVSEKKPPRVSPVAQKLAADLQISVDAVQGTGVQGKIMKADVLKAAEESKSPTKEEGLFGKTLAMSKMRQVIARRLSGSAFTAPHIYLFIDVNMEKAIDLRDSILEDFEKKYHVRLSINDFLIKAVSLAIRDYPLLNATIRGDEIYIHPEINVGLAVALEDGLIVPAMTQVDRLGLGGIAQQRADLVDRARQGKLTLNEIERGTFTISSLGNFDVRFFTAIINPPQSGILSVGKIEDQLYREKGEVKERKVVHLGLSVDHRIIDGAVAARFLQTIKKIMENPSFYFLNL